MTDRALDVMLVMCVDQDKSLVIVTPKYLVDETSLIEMSLMVKLYVIGLCLRVILMNTLLSGLINIPDLVPHCDKELRSF